MSMSGTSNLGDYPASQVSPAEWWRRDGLSPPHVRLTQWVDHLERLQSYRRRALLLHATLYGALPTVGMAVNEFARTTPGVRSNISLNVCKNMVDAVTSKIAAKARPNLSFSTSGADFDDERKAEDLDRGVKGVFYQNKFDRTSKLTFRDGCIFGTGSNLVYGDVEDKKVCISRLKTWQVIVDDAEAGYDDGPRSLFVRRYYDKGYLEHLYPKYRDEIRASKIDPGDESWGFGYDATAFRAEVTFGWHKQAANDADDGRLTVALRTVTLQDEPWHKKRFPTSHYKWSEPMEGFYGVGLCEELLSIQMEINKLLRQIQQGHHLVCGRWLIETSSDVVVSHINNDLSTIVRYSGIKPEYIAPSIIASEMYEHLWNLYAKAYEISGVSQLGAQAQKPAGFDSGEAMRRAEDIQTERFLDTAQRFEDYVLDTGQLVVEEARDLADTLGSYEVRLPAGDVYDTIDWKKLPDTDGFEMVAQPTSAIPGTPTGKIQYATDMMKLNVYDPEDLLEVMDMPDTSGITARKLASRRMVERIIGSIMSDGKWYSPEPFLNLPQARKIATDAYLVYSNKRKVPEKRLRLLRDWIKEVEMLIKRGEAAAPATPPGPPAAMQQPMAPQLMQPPQPNGAAPPVAA